MTIEQLKEQFQNDITTKAIALEAIKQLEQVNSELRKENALLKDKLGGGDEPVGNAD